MNKFEFVREFESTTFKKTKILYY